MLISDNLMKKEKIYKKLKDELEPKYKGKIVAIEIDSGEYFFYKR